MSFENRMTKFDALRKEFNIPTVRKTTKHLRLDPHLATAVIGEKMQELGPRNGPETVRNYMRANDNVHVSR